MLKRPKRLLALGLLISAVTLYWGCSQPDEVLTDVTQTTIYLDPERLPSNPPGMVYNLCVAEGLVDDSVHNVNCFAEFGYNWDEGKFKVADADSADRPDSNQFLLPDDIMNYGYLFVSVQRTDGSDPGVGPVMLIDNVTDPDNDPLDLVFPHVGKSGDSVGIMYFNMKTVTNDTVIGLTGLQGEDSINLDTEEELAGSAIWFSTMLYNVGVIQDTTEVCDWWVDTLQRDSLDSCQISIVSASGFSQDTVQVGYGLDTLPHTAIVFDIETHTECPGSPSLWDTTSQESVYLTTNFEVLYWCGDSLCGGDSANAAECDPDFPSNSGFARPDSFNYHDFQYIGGTFKDMSKYGWHYEGWVVSSVIEDAGASIGDMTPPAWINYNSFNDSAIVGIEGGLLSTGKFLGPTEDELSGEFSFSWPGGGADEGNPYSSDLHIPPPFPGEDFLNVPIEGGGTSAINLVPDNGGPYGTVFITFEPTNDPHDSTNFPLIVNSEVLPANRGDALTDLTQTQSFAMTARYNVNSGAAGPVLIGMPRIRVDIDRL
jgi:hypothetical protein